MPFFLPKCPKCGATNLKENKPRITMFKKAIKFSESSAMPLLSFKKKSDDELPSFTCKHCGFSWPKRN